MSACCSSHWRGAFLHAVAVQALLEHPDYYAYRESLLNFLADYEHNDD